MIGGHADVGVLSGGGSSQVRSVGGAPIEIPLTSGAAASFARITYHASSPLEAIRELAPGRRGQLRRRHGSRRRGRGGEGRRRRDRLRDAVDRPRRRMPDSVAARQPGRADRGGRRGQPQDRGRCSRPAGRCSCPGSTGSPACSRPGIPASAAARRSRPSCSATVNPSGRLPITFPRSADAAAAARAGRARRAERRSTS